MNSTLEDKHKLVEVRMLDMFKVTCNYLQVLIEEIIGSGIEIPQDISLVSNEITAKLLLFTNNIYQQNTRIKETGTNLANRDIKNSCETSLYPFSNNKGEVKVDQLVSHHRSLTIRPTNSLESPSQNMDVLKGNSEETIKDLASNSSAITISQNRQNTQIKETGIKLPNRDIKNSSETSLYLLNNIKGEVKVDQITSPLRSLTVNLANSLASSSQNMDVSEENSEKTIHDHASDSIGGSQTSLFSLTSQKEDTKNSQLDKLTNKNDVNKKIYIKNENYYITMVFKNFIEEQPAFLKQPNFSSEFLIYCRCCDTIVSEEKWSYHKKKKLHISVDKAFKFTSTIIKCEPCKIMMYGQKSLMIKFFKYHNSILHKNTNEIKNQNISVFLNNPYTEENNSLSASTSLSNSLLSLPKEVSASSRTINKNPSEEKSINSVYNIIDPYRKESINPLSASTSLSSSLSSLAKEACDISRPSNKIPQNEKSNINIVTEDERVPLIKKNSPISPNPDENHSLAFVDFISQVKHSVKETKTKLEVGFCATCDKGFISGFEWFDHMEGSHSKLEKNSLEAQCDVCLLKVFGDMDVIYNKFLENPVHWDLDSLIEEGLL